MEKPDASSIRMVHSGLGEIPENDAAPDLADPNLKAYVHYRDWFNQEHVFVTGAFSPHSGVWLYTGFCFIKNDPEPVVMTGITYDQLRDGENPTGLPMHRDFSFKPSNLKNIRLKYCPVPAADLAGVFEFIDQMIISKQMSKTPLHGPDAFLTLETRRDLYHNLSLHEKQIIELIVKRKNNWEIAATLALNKHTLKAHIGLIFKTLNIKNRAQIIQLFEDICLQLDQEPNP